MTKSIETDFRKDITAESISGTFMILPSTQEKQMRLVQQALDTLMQKINGKNGVTQNVTISGTTLHIVNGVIKKVS